MQGSGSRKTRRNWLYLLKTWIALTKMDRMNRFTPWTPMLNFWNITIKQKQARDVEHSRISYHSICSQQPGGSLLPARALCWFGLAVSLSLFSLCLCLCLFLCVSLWLHPILSLLPLPPGDANAYHLHFPAYLLAWCACVPRCT